MNQLSILYSEISISFTFLMLNFDLMWINASLKKETYDNEEEDHNSHGKYNFCFT